MSEPTRPESLRGIAFLVCGFDTPGGMEGQARRLAEGVAARGVPVVFVTTSPSRHRRTLRQEFGNLTLYRVPVLSGIDWATTLGILEVTALQVIGRRREELSAIYTVHHEVGAIASRVGEATGLPVVVKFACSGSLGDAYTVLHHNDRDALLKALRRIDRLAAITDEIAREGIELLGLHPTQVARLENGIDLEKFPRRTTDPDPSAPSLLFVGRMSVQKRVDVLLRAASILVRSDFPNLRLKLAGRGPLLAALQVQAERLGLRERVEFLGVRDDVPQLLAETTLLVLPSSVEGTSNSVLEAMASGAPVVATRVQGTKELIRDRQDGLLVPPGDPQALAAAISEILRDPAFGRRLAESARKRVEERHDQRVVIQAHLDLFCDLAEGKTPTPLPLPRRPRGSTRLIRAATYAGLRTGLDAVRSTANIVADQVRRPEDLPPGLRRGVALLVRDIDALGGMERQAGNLAKSLVAQGVKVTIITCTSPGLLTMPSRDGWSETRDGARLYRVPLVLYESAAASILFRHREDWGVIYSVQLMMGAIGARLGRLFDAPVVVKLACGGPWGDMAALKMLEPDDRRQVQQDLAQCHLVPVSEEIAHEARAAGFDPALLVKIPNGVNVEAVRSSPIVQPVGEDPTILFAGRLDPQKGVDLLVHAFTHVARKVPFVQLLLAGTGSMRGDLEQLARKDGTFDRVHFLGRRDDVWGLLRGATVCALPSRSEGLSNFLLEAMSAGTPVVATRIKPNVEALGEGAGLLVPADDVLAFAHALIELLENPALRSGLATAGKARADGVFSMDRVTSQYTALFDRLPPGTERPTSKLRFAGRFLGARRDDMRRVIRRLGAGL